MSITRRVRPLFSAAVLAAGLAAGLFAAGGVAAETIELKVSHFLPPQHTIHKELVRWGQELEDKSGGRIKLAIFPAAQMGPMPRQFDLARRGVADIAFSLHGGTPGRYPLTEVANLPFLVKSSEASSKALTELIPDYLSKEYEGLRALYTIVVPPLNLNMSKKRITSVDDLKGLRIRHAGRLFAETIQALGATPVAVRPNEIADSMSKGVVDGALLPFEGAAAFKLGDVTKYVLEPGINAATFALMMNPAKYESLPEDLRKLIDDTTGPEAAARIGRAFDEAEVHGREVMGEKAQIDTMSPELRADFEAAIAPVTENFLGELDEKGLPAREVYAKMKAAGA
ncbi:TRAP transporter substrate-binding protein [Breoghania sp. L-A4]|uniref:TRAP transporter substrate-binding protein n=1 Tax=Breoghania sp. L-A4 TaxID=2304600 RepID=UPI000E359968|nr:TRAP transporter substrate-binding protein [Breoghania sp. L-A4]AXS42173.1 hypothetical protein D1F64_21930 [Breoghania sp. L-A4]